MIVCLCTGLNDQKLQHAIDGGASSLKALGAKTGAGMHCGSCRCDLRKLLEEAAIARCSNLAVAAEPGAK